MVYKSKVHRCLSLIAEEMARLDKPEVWRIARIYDIVDNYYETEARKLHIQEDNKAFEEATDEKESK